ncbi:hypothetical protein PGT21_005263 [Puccinia graminis f. sp. tritici]|uniref:Pseudouridine synthase RsuA/RluA-like domain-containing protein n=1 Tax=Puccinia graminis f. sp. tritici TaxID=56615 RepID=A0A5B0QHI0_PUCGR|nr:hypothetical protein PGT21_005263 [Puccinia graminis f. sp. tritici]
MTDRDKQLSGDHNIPQTAREPWLAGDVCQRLPGISHQKELKESQWAESWAESDQTTRTIHIWQGTYYREHIFSKPPPPDSSPTHSLNLPDGPLNPATPPSGRPITGRSHQLRVHLQFLGFPILNNTIYCNLKAWGPSHGKGGIFFAATTQTEATAEDEPAPNESEGVAEGSGYVEKTEDSRVSLNGQQKRPSKSKLGRNQRQGISQVSEKRVKLHPESAEAGNFSGVPINQPASAVILELRKARNVEDDFGRVKDTIHIDKAFKSPLDLQLSVNANPPPNLPFDDKFCADCGIPLVPDPKPEQLYIHLHPFRYQTDSWDFSSELPWWANEQEWKTRRPSQ